MMAPFARARGNWQSYSLALAAIVIAAALVLLPLPQAALGVGGALALIAVLRYPEIALYAMIFAVPYGSLLPFSLGVGNLTAVDLFVALVLALWLARMIALDRAIRIRWAPLTAPFALFLFVALLSVTGALSLQNAAKEWVKWFEMFAVYVFAAQTLDATRRTRALIVLLLAGLSEAVIGIVQFVFRIGPEGFALFGRFMRAYGTFEQPNPFAGYLALSLPIALAVLVGIVTSYSAPKATRGQDVHIWKLGGWNLERGVWLLGGVALVSFVGMLAGLLMSWSRGAWLGVGAGLVLVVVLQSRRALVLSIVAAFVLTFVILLSSINIIPNAIAERFSGIGDYFGVFDVRGVQVDDANYAIVERMALWQAAIEMWADHPILGVGFGNYAAVYPAYALPHWSDPLGHAHNYYLNVAAEAGSLGLLAYLALWGAAFWQGWRTLQATRGLEHSLAAGLLGMIVALSVQNGFDNLFVHGMAVQVGLGLGLAASLRPSRV